MTTFKTSVLDPMAWVEMTSSQIVQVAWVDQLDSERLGLFEDDIQWKDAPPDDGVLRPHMLVEFKPGKNGARSIYAYRGVSVDEFVAFCQTDESPGRALNLSIKGHFPYTKLKLED